MTPHARIQAQADQLEARWRDDSHWEGIERSDGSEDVVRLLLLRRRPRRRIRRRGCPVPHVDVLRRKAVCPWLRRTRHDAPPSPLADELRGIVVTDSIDEASDDAWINRLTSANAHTAGCARRPHDSRWGWSRQIVERVPHELLDARVHRSAAIRPHR